MSNKEAAAIGCNLSFAPVSDILYNWENPVIGLRTYGNDVDRVCEMTKAYMDGAHTNEGFCCAAKHFPGDGLDFRDQHVADSVNDMSCEEWDASYGKVYQNLIDNGLEAIMAGHIMQPAYTRHFNPGIKDEDIMPATLSPELIEGLLRGKLGFNGMVLTDASHMVGLTCCMKRSEMLPHTIAAGVDMFLFFNEMDEDFASMMAGYENGIITEERLNDALHRILALKAHMGLHKKAKNEIVPPVEVMERRAQGDGKRNLRERNHSRKIQGRGCASDDPEPLQAHHDRLRQRIIRGRDGNHDGKIYGRRQEEPGRASA